MHREALDSLQLSGDLNRVLEVAVKTVNFIKAKLLKAWLFQRLCDELRANRNNVLFYCMYCFIVLQGGFPKAKFFYVHTN